MARVKVLHTDPLASWREKGLCFSQTSVPPGAWTDPGTPFAEKIKDICQRECKVRDMCLRDAADDKQSEGWRAGFFFDGGTLDDDDRKRANIDFGVKAKGRRKKKDEPEEPVCAETPSAESVGV